MKRLMLILALLSVFVGISKAAGVHKRVLMIIAHDNFRDEELFVTKSVLEGCGAVVDVVSNRAGIARGMLGGTYKVDKTYRDVPWKDYHAIVLVGGSGATVFWEDSLLQALIKEAYHRGKVVAAICLSPITLAKAGILRGRRATCWMSVGNILSRYGAVYTGDDVVVSGRIVTAAGPFAARQFGRAICRLLGYR